ncbi:NAD(P)/FAD-dependent oxidoreductase [Novosphingobium mangrovi (ex Huang et al. 2023)]|uniref:NAD(P)/FAD-dependent oxidoreductase n=1 Tax=Novosphingobium mangrovi (ex Huang et al. 2023) TaxID=2976432 RepID=A0ABT2I240_9SPHN|nr:NAD(P)/FAD-dependent oxidoreductase [Novosphingobium mangrovi (ex Huang et al. 2023)]MCT2398876.1 NAD(P)/FAD-dependent oxidoreductase [Novosphingobium mangrovi (ex Huang et al. 2023)]
MDEVGAIVVGAGVVGLAIGRALAMAGHEVMILEREAQFGTVTSSRNSGVIHAGLYYPDGSLKAQLCVEGRHLLYDFCERRDVDHRRCGKLIIAASEEEFPALDAVMARGASAGVDDLVRISPEEARAIEPALTCAGAIHSPSTGIVDQHGLMLALLGEAEAHGAMLVCDTPVDAITRNGACWTVQAGETQLATPILVNAAGLGAQALARTIEALDPELVPPLFLAKGCYFSYAGRAPFTHLIYPVPGPASLGTHFTLDLGGQARFGPDIHWVDAIDYTVDPALKPEFLAAARRIWPDAEEERLQPAYAGIRPKLAGPGMATADFMLQDETTHGLPGLVNLFGIESPGLTSSLAIAERVAAMIGTRPHR